jgi:drug/metabolite transporter (DMT)-like permease
MNLTPTTRGYILGFIGVAIFSLTLPFTHVAVKELDPVFTAMGRTVAAAICAIIILIATRQPWPSKQDIARLAIVAAGVIFGFPLFSAIAMKTASASHGTVVLGLLPLATAFMSTIFAGEKPTRRFWLWSILGSALVIAFALWDGGTELRAADTLLVLAVITASMGYAAGGSLSRKLGGWQVICWALVVALPLTLPISLYLSRNVATTVSTATWLSFAYLALMSQLIGFFAWNKGLAMGGVAKVGQVQLLQTFMTLAAASLFFGDAFTLRSMIFALLVALCVWFGRKAQVKST